jgi:hypothetical protein
LKIFSVLHTVCILDTAATFIQDVFVSCSEDCVRNTQKCIYSMKWSSECIWLYETYLCNKNIAIYAIKISPNTPDINQLRIAHMQYNISDAFTHLCLIIPVFIRHTETIHCYISCYRFCWKLACYAKQLPSLHLRCMPVPV